MLQATIRIGEREYLLPAEHDREELMRTITSQVRAGGGFVEVVRTPDRVVNVLVSPGTNVCIEVRRIDVEDESEASGQMVDDPWWEQSWLEPFDLM
jgi:hypothetical protein